ncbi:MAG: class II aldolase/adducin family protein, partial [Pirellulales bacterium]|nr:class II aldolase/adducin family protein [Pirellulales bacterium]
MRCSSGNISRRLDDTRLLATSTRSWLEKLSKDEVTVCRIADGAMLEGPQPTIEIGFHAGILKARPDINVVMHFQTPFATTLACRETDNIDYCMIPEIPFYIGHVARVPYFLPGSKELADAVTMAMKDHDMVVMSNHGMVTIATDYGHVIQNAQFFELACEVIIRGGDRLKPLSKEDIDRLLELRQG